MNRDELLEAIKAITAPLPASRALRDRVLEDVERLVVFVEAVAELDPDIGLMDIHGLVADATALLEREREPGA